MNRFLPKSFIFLAVLVLSLGLFVFVSPSFAQPVPTSTPTTAPSITPTPTIPSSHEQNSADPGELPSDWIIDPEVTNIGKNAARAGLFLDWSLEKYKWEYVNAGQSPLIPFWITIRNIVYSFLILVVITASLVLIVTRGRSLTLRKFLPRFVVIAILVTFSFAFVEFLYQVVDVFQGFFISPGGHTISQKDLLYVGWTYKDFVGLRALGDANFESAFISLLLVKLTSFTYYAMVGILLVRKIILWFFIMVCPFFPLLILFYPLRNTAKIWLGEFFRWLLYAPLFAIFLAGLVSLWRIGIPLSFNFDNAQKGFVVFPTAVSILLGGPLQNVGVANSVNLADTFGLYLVALLMLWMVIIFPFILLQIFLDYISNINVNQNALARQIMSLIARPPSPTGGIPPSPSPSAGLARSLPFFRDFTTPKPEPATTGLAREIPRQFQTQRQTQTVTVRPLSKEQRETIEKMTNIAVPTLRDIARYDSSSIRHDTDRQKEVEKIKENLLHIETPRMVSDSTRRERYQEMRESLLTQSKTGNPLAMTILNAAKTIGGSTTSNVSKTTTITSIINNLANPSTVTNTTDREKYVEIKERLSKEKDSSSFASSVLSAVHDTSMASSSAMTSLLTSLRSESSRDTKVTALKETIQKEATQGDVLATSLQKVLAEKTDADTHVITALLEKEKAAGNPLAVSVLALANGTQKQTTEKQNEKIQSLETEIAKEKEKGNQLAIMLSDLMAKQQSALPSVAELPKANRIQEVSLDDYEAVKQMWTENYEQETTDDEETKKQMIEEEMHQIDEAIGLLTSDDKEKVEQGMQKVSDILPFLLVGGFSTSEVVAYLKAKQAAGKDVVNEIEKKLGDEETKIDVKRSSTRSSNVQTRSEEVALPSSSDSERNVSRISVDSAAAVSPKFVASASKESAEMLRLANIAIPTIKTIASFDEAMVSHDTKREQEVEKVQETLRRIANPNAALDSTGREQYTQIRNSLLSEGKKGNTIASAIVSAGKLSDRLSAESVFTGVLKLSSLIQEWMHPESIPDQKEKEDFEKLRQTLTLQSANGDFLAGDILAFLKKDTTPSLSDTILLLSSLEGAAKEGNQLAVTLMQKANAVPDARVTTLRDQLIGMYLLTSSLALKETSKNTHAESVRSIIAKKAEEGNQLAKEVLSGGVNNEPSSVIALTTKILSSKDPFAQELLSYGESFVRASNESRESEQDHSLRSLFMRLFSPKDDKQAHEANEQVKLLEKAAKEGNSLAALFLTKTDEATRLQIKALSDILRAVADPSSLSPSDRESFKDMKGRLQKEALAQNQLALEILSIANVLSKGGADLSSLDKTTLCVLLWQTLTAEKVNGDAVAGEVLSLAQTRSTKQQRLVQIQDLITELSHIDLVKDDARKSQLLSFKKKILTEHELNNPLAGVLAQAISTNKKEEGKKDILNVLEQKLEDETNVPFVKDFLSLLSRDESEASFAMLRVLKCLATPNNALSEDEKEGYVSLRKALEDASAHDSSVAMSLLAAAERISAGDDIAEARKAEELLSHENSDAIEQIKLFIEKEKSVYRDVMLLRNILHDLLNPSYIVDDESKKAYEFLRQAIDLEASHANPVAKAIEKTLTLIAADASIEDEIAEVSTLYQTLCIEKENGNNRASEMIALVKSHSLREKAEKLVSVLEGIWDLKRVNGLDREIYQKVRDELVSAKNQHDNTATLLLSVAQSFVEEKVDQTDEKGVVELLLKKLTVEDKRGNTFAQSILALMKPSVEKEKEAMASAIEKAEKTNDPLLKPLLSELASADDTTAMPITLIPSENTVQEVSVEDYESVRSMWTESFGTLPVPSTLSGERLSRTEWLRRQVSQVTNAIDLLSSEKAEKVSEGMRHIDAILPFLLIGGFSLKQIVSYLKAKREAAKTVLAQLGEASEQMSAKKVDKQITEESKASAL